MRGGAYCSFVDVSDDGKTHSGCDVVAVCGCQAPPAGAALPLVCPCECKTCFRAWEQWRRPVVVDGQVVFA